MTNKTQILDSLTFLSIARNVIRDSIDFSDIKEKKDLKYFITNEASDYQIMSLLIDETLPENKYDVIAESELWDRFKRSVTRNYKNLSESLNSNILENIIFEIGPVSNLGLSSMKPILEFQMNEGFLDNLKDITQNEKRKNDNVAQQAKDEMQQAHREEMKKKLLRPDIVAQKGQGIEGLGSVLKKTIKATGKQAGIGLAALTAAALVIYGGYKIYQRFFSQAAKACSKLSGSQRDQCVKKFRIDAMKTQISDLNKGMSTCSKSKDPAKCKQIISDKIKKLQTKINAQ